MSIPTHIQSLPTCPETGLKVQTYESSINSNWEPSLPAGWAVFDDRMDGHDPECQKWHEYFRSRRIGPEQAVLLAYVAAIPGITFVPAETC